MRVNASCARCLYDKQQRLTDNSAYLSEIKSVIDRRGEEDTSPYLVYRFNKIYERHFGKRAPYREVKKKYNDLVLSMEEVLRKKIRNSENPLETAFVYARIGNYIDFGAIRNVDEATFLSLFDRAEMSGRDSETMHSFTGQLAGAETFLLITDNCGEIVLDKLFLEEIKRLFPSIEITTLVRGGEILNDATKEDAEYVRIDRISRILDNGDAMGGTVYAMLPDDAKAALDTTDVILAKGQGNYESLSGQGRHIFYSFLCKCELFTTRFGVSPLTGMFVEENDLWSENIK